MTVAKSQINLFVLIWIAVTAGISLPAQGASLINTPSSHNKNSTLPTLQTNQTGIKYVDMSHQPEYSLQLPPDIGSRNVSLATPTLSQNIAQLEEAGKVKQETVGNTTIYTYNAKITSPKNISSTRYYSNRWQLPKVISRQRVPESSPVLSLLLFMGFLIKARK
jgi:hypothetical protein